jgi:hypothetical protein
MNPASNKEAGFFYLEDERIKVLRLKSIAVNRKQMKGVPMQYSEMVS